MDCAEEMPSMMKNLEENQNDYIAGIDSSISKGFHYCCSN